MENNSYGDKNGKYYLELYITMYYTVFLLRSKLMNNIGKIMVTLQIKTPNPHPIQIKNILVGGERGRP